MVDIWFIDLRQSAGVRRSLSRRQLFDFRFRFTPFRPDQVMTATASPESSQKIVFTPRPRQPEQLHAVIHTAIARPTLWPEPIENSLPFSVDVTIQVHIPDIHFVPG